MTTTHLDPPRHELRKAAREQFIPHGPAELHYSTVALAELTRELSKLTWHLCEGLAALQRDIPDKVATAADAVQRTAIRSATAADDALMQAELRLSAAWQALEHLHSGAHR